MNEDTSLKEKIERMSFEKALSEFERIVSVAESGEEELEKVIEDFRYGNALKAHCEKKLKEAKLKIDKIVQNNDGSVGTEQLKL